MSSTGNFGIQPSSVDELRDIDPKISSLGNQRPGSSPTRLSPAAQINRSNTSSPRRQGIQLSIPIQSSPRREVEINDVSSENSFVISKRNSFSSDHDPTIKIEANQDLLFKLAAKKRQIVELQQALNLAKKELNVLESHYKSMISSENNPNSLDSFNEMGPHSPTKSLNDKAPFWSKCQKTYVDISNSPKVLKSKQSISNFLNNDISNVPQPEDQKTEATKTTFFQNILNKFNEFSVAEEEEEEFDRTQNKHKDNFYLKDKLEYDDEEEIETEATGQTLLTGKKNIKYR